MLLSRYRDKLRDLVVEDAGKTYDAWELPAVIERAWFERATEANVRAGFKSCGLWPFNHFWMYENEQLFYTSVTKMKNEPAGLGGLYTPQIFGPQKVALPRSVVQHIFTYLASKDLDRCRSAKGMFQYITKDASVSLRRNDASDPQNVIQLARDLHVMNRAPFILRKILQNPELIEQLGRASADVIGTSDSSA